MGQTSHGVPYPVGTDRLMDGDDSIRAMAEFLDDAVYNPPRGKLYLAANSGNLALSAWTSFTSLSAAYTKGGVSQIAPSQLRVPKAGLYAVEAQVYYSTASASGAGQRRGVRCHLNGSNATGLVEGMTHTHASIGPVAVHTSNKVELAANDTLALAFWHDQSSGGMTAVGNSTGSYTFLTVYWLAAI